MMMMMMMIMSKHKTVTRLTRKSWSKARLRTMYPRSRHFFTPQPRFRFHDPPLTGLIRMVHVSAPHRFVFFVLNSHVLNFMLLRVLPQQSYRVIASTSIPLLFNSHLPVTLIETGLKRDTCKQKCEIDSQIPKTKRCCCCCFLGSAVSP